MTEMNDYQKYYVYFHCDGDEIVYIGVGTSCRAFRATGFGHRDKEHGAWLEGEYHKGNIPVSIKYTGLTKKEALNIEKDLIKKHKPKYNKMLNPDYNGTKFHPETVESAKGMRELGYSYTQIAYLLGAESLVSRENTKSMTIWRMVNEH